MVADLPALAAHRALSGVFGIDRRLAAFERQYSERGDLPGVQLFLRVLRITVEAMKRELVATSRDKLGGKYAPDPNYVLEVGSDDDSGEIEPEEEVLVVPLEPRLSVQFVDEFESQLRQWADLLATPQGRRFDSLAEPFRRLARDIPNEDEFELIFRPVPERVYGIWFEVVVAFDRIAQTLDRNLADTLDALPRLWAIEYPVLQEADTFQHACIAHEIGHIAFEARGLGQSQGNGERILLEAVEELGDQNVDDELVLNWYTELACDLLAIRMLGPAFALALTEWTLTQNVWFHQEGSAGYISHPPMPWRLSLLKGEIERYVPSADTDAQVWLTANQVVDRWMSVIPEREPSESPELQVVLTALGKLQDRADELLGPATFNPQVFVRDLPAVWRKLEDDMAPSEAIYSRGEGTSPAPADAWSEPIDWRSILNGGYVHYLARLALEMPPPENPPTLLRESADRHQTRLRACTHIQGAIELSETHRKMLELRGQLAALDLPDLP